MLRATHIAHGIEYHVRDAIALLLRLLSLLLHLLLKDPRGLLRLLPPLATLCSLPDLLISGIGSRGA